jgi:hypothetical protein
MNIYFQNELQDVLKKYSNFSIKKNEKQIDYLKGILDISNCQGNIVGSFSVEIYPTEKFPYHFPKIYEVGEEIPNIADWHKYPDNSCCITVKPDEIIKCKDGISIIQFIENFAIPYFANQIYRKLTGKYLKEYSHGIKGLKEFYIEFFKSNNINLWNKTIDNCIKNIRNERNQECYCNSKIKYKKCHLQIENDIRIIGIDRVINDIKIIKDEKKNIYRFF